MAENSGFFASVGGDRQYTTDFLADWVSSFISNGVYNGELAVTAGDGMTVTLPAGRAWINGYYYRNDGDMTLTIDNADGVLDRKDTIVLRWDVNNRNITAQVVEGTFSSEATAPGITRTDEQYDLKLAEISIPAGTTKITQSMITDTRLDTSVCGIVTSVIDQVDTSTFYNQIAADLAEFKSKNESEFESWFESIKDILDDDTAGNLLTMIQDHISNTNNPHQTTAEQTGAIPSSEKGVANGVATLNEDGTLKQDANTLGGKTSNEYVQSFDIGAGSTTVRYIKIAEMTTDIGTEKNGLILYIHGISNFGKNTPGLDILQASTRDGINVEVKSILETSDRSVYYGYVENKETGKTEIWLKLSYYNYPLKIFIGLVTAATVFTNATTTTTEPSGINYVNIGYLTASDTTSIASALTLVEGGTTPPSTLGNGKLWGGY